MDITLFEQDLPKDFPHPPRLAIDTEAMGLNPHRDRLCLVQLTGDGKKIYLIQTSGHPYEAPRLRALLEDPSCEKIFHFARFDVALLQKTYGIRIQNIFCTKVASKLVRTFTDRHGLKDLCRDLLGVELSKVQQTSDWGAPQLNEAQKTYAAQDVVHLHALRQILHDMLERENRRALAQKCFDFIPVCADLDVLGFENLSIFQHSS